MNSPFVDTVEDKERGTIIREGIRGGKKYRNETTFKGAPLTYKMDPSWRTGAENATLKAKANAAQSKNGSKNNASSKNSTGTGAKNNSAPSSSSLLQLNAEISLEQRGQHKLNI